MKKIPYLSLALLIAGCGPGNKQPEAKKELVTKEYKSPEEKLQQAAAAGMPVVYKVNFKQEKLQLSNEAGSFNFQMDTSSLIDYQRTIKPGISKVLIVHFTGTYSNGGRTITTGEQQLLLDDGTKISSTGNSVGNYFTPSGNPGRLNFEIPDGKKPVKLLLHAADNDAGTEIVVTNETRPYNQI